MSTSTTKEKRPKRLTMAGMIYDAHELLEWAMDQNQGGLSPDLFGPGLVGVCFMNIVEVGFVFSGNVGTGIVLARQPNNDSNNGWSPPSAIGISGLGWGFIAGASLKHIVYMIYDERTMQAMAGDVGVKLGAQLEASRLNWGRTAEITSIITNQGLGANVGLSYSRGIFGGISLEGAVCNPRSRVNELFYGKKVTPHDILFQPGAVSMPDQPTLYQELIRQLNFLCAGKAIYEPTDEIKALKASLCPQVDREGEDFVAQEEQVEYVAVPVNKENPQPVADGESILTTMLE